LNGAETCDDGNTTTETECPYNVPNCTACNASCSSTLSLTGLYCGDGAQNHPSEVCDDGNNTDEATCPYGQASCSTCNADCSATLSRTGPVCGDDTRNMPFEACDDGNTANETECPYNVPNCMTCNATCTGTLSLTGLYCGDGVQNHPSEVCDDGNNVDETECPYGQATCTRCNADCSAPIPLTGAVCGDGSTNAPDEVCDDGNTNACGTCNASCSTVQFSFATGLIDATGSGNMRDGETFTIGDGIHPPVIFEFDKDGTTSPVHIRINASTGSADVMATTIRNAINGVGASLEITAMITFPLDFVRLTHDQRGSFGNQPITDTVAYSLFVVTGMSGGAGVDCPEGTRCKMDSDCQLGLGCVLAGTTGICGTPATPPVDGLTSRE
jgi:cysteine-rich repeat protein